MSNAFKKAVKSESKLRMALAGPSGAGKTYTALAIAQALASDKPVAVIDTERGSASKYADLFQFDVLELDSFHPDRYIEAILMAQEAGYGVLVIDSLSHAWNGKGGLLEIVDAIAKRSYQGNTFRAWGEATPIQNRLIDTITTSRLHILATMRSKTEYVVENNDRGKSAPRKVGTVAVQRDGMEYEFDVFGQMTIENELIIEKSRCPALAGQVIRKPGAEVANILSAWLHGAPVPAPQAPQTPQVARAPISTPTPTPDEWMPLRDVALRQALNRLGVRKPDDVKVWIESFRQECAESGVEWTSANAIAAVNARIELDNAQRIQQRTPDLSTLDTGAVGN